ncbi:DUF3781 domain-containing protein [bacterium 210820-DFI.6.52]|nr:DUF3781 domain-containing protein [bacterium 210820-DFI.6.52]
MHTTPGGAARVKRNLALDTDDVVEWCREKIVFSGAAVSVCPLGMGPEHGVICQWGALWAGNNSGYLADCPRRQGGGAPADFQLLPCEETFESGIERGPRKQMWPGGEPGF